MSTVNFDGASGFLVRAKTQRAGVVLLPTIFGVNPFVRDFATALAGEGITTLIWDIYPGEALPGGYDEAIKRAGRLTDKTSLPAMTKCVDFMVRELRIGAVGTMGFCLGGRYVFLHAAHDKRLAACLSIYPSIHTPEPPRHDDDAVTAAAEIACPVQLIYPAKDHITTNETFARLQQNLQRRTVATVVQLLPLASHGFMHNDAPENKAADRLARPLVAPFLNACLG